jgi:hypothetical protein
LIIIKKIKKLMAKAKGASSNSVKVTFGKKTKGKFKKKYGPKDQKPKRYRGQGRG